MKRKGISPVVAWVLLLGFSITLAAITTVYVKSTAERQIEQTTLFIEGGMECDDLFWNIRYLGGSNNDFNLSNTGGKTIKGYNYKLYASDGEIISEEENVNIPPGNGVLLGIGGIDSFDKIEFTPIIIFESKRIGCSNKKISITKETWALLSGAPQ